MPYKNPTSEVAKECRRLTAERYYEKKKETILIKNKTDPNRQKSSRKNNWKRRGVIGNLDELYEKYMNTLNCEKCNLLFIETKYKCLDHNHITGEFRFILCKNCNNFDNHLN